MRELQEAHIFVGDRNPEGGWRYARVAVVPSDLEDVAVFTHYLEEARHLAVDVLGCDPTALVWEWAGVPRV